MSTKIIKQITCDGESCNEKFAGDGSDVFAYIRKELASIGWSNIVFYDLDYCPVCTKENKLWKEGEVKLYRYEDHRDKTFTENGQVDLLKTRDKVKELLKVAGAFNITKVLVSGDGWLAMAYVDRLVELGEIKELTNRDCRGQDRVFIDGKLDN